MSHGIVKFIVTKDQVYLGTESALNETCRDIAAKHQIKQEDVLGGGWANVNLKAIYRRSQSHEFGAFDKALVQRLLPDFVMVDETC